MVRVAQGRRTGVGPIPSQLGANNRASIIHVDLYHTHPDFGVIEIPIGALAGEEILETKGVGP